MSDQKASSNVPAAETDATERELVEDAQWKTIQKNCFTRWTNEQLKKVGKEVVDLETDLSDGLLLIALVEVLSGKKCPKFNKSPNNRTEKLDNVTMTLKFLEEHEAIKIVNIHSSDIVDHNLKLILGLIWTLIQHYFISKLPVWEDEEGRPQKQEQTPKQRLLGWIQGKLPNRPVRNFTTDWNDGIAIGALVDGVAPGLSPDWKSWNPENNVENATKAMNAAEEWLDVPQLIQPTEMCNPNVDEMSMMTYLSQFTSTKLKPGAPLRPESSKLVESRVFVIGISHGDELRPPSKDVVKINLNQPAEVSYTTPIPTQMILESAAAVYRNSIFVTGTGQHSTEIWRFDAFFSTWAQCASLLQRRRRHSVAFVDHILYMCGGYVDEHVGYGVRTTLDDVEAYDVRKNRCQSVGKLALAVESSGNCVPFKSSLYIFGGTGAQGKFQVYDTKSNECTLLSQSVLIDETYFRAVQWESTAILVGINGSCTYNFETKVFEKRPKCKIGSIYYGLAIFDDLVFVIGGGRAENWPLWICEEDVRCAPVASILSDEPIEWKLHAKMPSPSLVYAFGQMDLEP